MPTALLTDRGVVSVTGPDAAKLLQGLITNDIELAVDGRAIHAGLLSPQGKILFDFFVMPTDTGFLLDVARVRAAELAKRLTMYRLRADAAIADVSGAHQVFAQWAEQGAGGRRFTDPRDDQLGVRVIADAPVTHTASADDYHARRIALGIPEGGKDYDFGDAVPHEANFDLFNGVSFTKGCYVGQEVVARMQNKSVVRKRIVRVEADSPLTSGAEILLGDVAIGSIGSTSGDRALAMLRLDRAAEAQDKAIDLTSSGFRVTPDAEAIARYRASAAQRPAANLPS